MIVREYKTLLPYVKKYRWFYIAGIFSLLITSGGQIIIPQYFRMAIDMIEIGDFPVYSILNLMLQMIGIAIMIAVFRFAWRFFIHGASRRIEKELRERLFFHISNLSAGFHGKAKVGDLMARATNDMKAIRMAAGMALVAFTDGLFMTIAILIILFNQFPRIALLTFIPLPLVSIWILGLGRLIGERFKLVQEGFSSLNERSQESFSGIRVIKSFGKENYFLEKFKDVNLEYQARNLKLVRIWGLLFPIVTFLSGVTILILLRFGGESVILGNMSPGNFVAVLSYLEMLVWPMIGAGFTINLIQRGAASLGRVNRILEERADIASPSNPVRHSPQGRIEVKNLSFRYPDSVTPALKDISFSLKKGKILGILGKTGSGKTTLVRLLPRIIDPPEGTVFIDGHDVRSYDLSTLRSSFGFVPQNIFLFSTSINENIAFGNPNLDQERIKKMAAISTINRDLQDFPEGGETQIGERGISLSGGQKQRVAISRALAIDPAILILDDALSAVDTETEEEILNSLKEEFSEKTVILIAHRVSTLALADTIIVLEDGRITEKGSHEELLKQEGFYREIFELQHLENGRA